MVWLKLNLVFWSIFTAECEIIFSCLDYIVYFSNFKVNLVYTVCTKQC